MTGAVYFYLAMSLGDSRALVARAPCFRHPPARPRSVAMLKSQNNNLITSLPDGLFAYNKIYLTDIRLVSTHALLSSCCVSGSPCRLIRPLHAPSGCSG